MNILFMSLSDYKSIYIHGLYPDLLKQFVNHGNNVYLISPIERRNFKRQESVVWEKGTTIIKPKIWNMQKNTIIEKSISMLTIDRIFIRSIKKYLSDVKFDLILYPTPPITLLNAVEYVKKRDGAETYLLLKDIFPQNAVDLGMMCSSGLKGLLYKYFRKKEKRLYAISDHIGCMSQANVNYIIKHNTELRPDKVDVCPNTIDPIDMSCLDEERWRIRTQYGIPLNKTVYVYGGNLGKPQGIPFIIECLRKCKDIENAFFLIVGNGTEYGKFKKFLDEEKQGNVRLLKCLPKEDYDHMIGSCDIGLIFLDHRFTIPNFPSRLLSYMAAKLPVLTVTDVNTDVGRIVVDEGFGWWHESNDSIGFSHIVEDIIADRTLRDKGEKGFKYLEEHYSSSKGYEIISKNLKTK